MGASQHQEVESVDWSRAVVEDHLANLLFFRLHFGEFLVIFLSNLVPNIVQGSMRLPASRRYLRLPSYLLIDHETDLGKQEHKVMADICLRMRVSLASCIRYSLLIYVHNAVYFYLFDILPLALAIGIYIFFWPSDHLIHGRQEQIDTYQLAHA